jgi:branched-chain amino acid transport system substrate-binding protein
MEAARQVVSRTRAVPPCGPPPPPTQGWAAVGVEDKEEARSMKLRNLGALVGVAVLAASACQPGAGPGATGPGATGAAKGTLKIGVELPLSGGEAPNGQPTLKGAKLAIDEANAKGGVGGYRLELNVQDDAVAGKNNPEQGAKNMTTLVSDPDVVAVIGPYNSAVAKAQIPISNEAGVLQCSPANTNPDLTKPPAALDLRKAKPDKPNYVRVATTDDIQGPAGASYAFNDLGKKRVLIIDDVTTFGKGVADEFEKRFKALGGTVAQRVGADKNTTDFVPILTAAKANNPDVVYYGGVTTSGGGLLRKQMPQVGMGDLPFVGPDGVVDGGGDATGSFINISGPAAANAYGTIAAIGDFPAKADFEKRYADHYANDSEFKTAGAYSGPAYACAQIVLKALETVAANTDKAGLREAIRAYALGGNEFDTVLGKVKFDQNGDTSQKIISFYKTDMSAKGGKGDWVFEKQQDFGAA